MVQFKKNAIVAFKTNENHVYLLKTSDSKEMLESNLKSEAAQIFTDNGYKVEITTIGNK